MRQSSRISTSIKTVTFRGLQNRRRSQCAFVSCGLKAPTGYLDIYSLVLLSSRRGPVLGLYKLENNIFFVQTGAFHKCFKNIGRVLVATIGLATDKTKLEIDRKFAVKKEDLRITTAKRPMETIQFDQDSSCMAIAGKHFACHR